MLQLYRCICTISGLNGATTITINGLFYSENEALLWFKQWLENHSIEHFTKTVGVQIVDGMKNG